jgi:hypothetical protein
VIDHVHVAQRICTVQQIEASVCVLLVLEDGVREIAVEPRIPLGRLEVVVSLMNQQLSIDLFGLDNAVVEGFPAHSVPHLLQESSSSEQRLSSLQALALDAVGRPVNLLTLFGAVAYVNMRSTVGVRCLVAASAVGIGVVDATVGAFLFALELVGGSVDIRKAIVFGVVVG